MPGFWWNGIIFITQCKILYITCKFEFWELKCASSPTCMYHLKLVSPEICETLSICRKYDYCQCFCKFLCPAKTFKNLFKPWEISLWYWLQPSNMPNTLPTSLTTENKKLISHSTERMGTIWLRGRVPPIWLVPWWNRLPNDWLEHRLKVRFTAWTNKKQIFIFRLRPCDGVLVGHIATCGSHMGKWGEWRNN